MPSLPEVRAYALGVRLEQAQRITRSVFPSPIVYSALIRLEEAVEWTRVISFSDSLGDRVKQLVRAALPCIGNEAPAVVVTETPLDFSRQQVEMVDAAIAPWLEAVDTAPALSNWFRLGRQIVRGEAGDYPRPGAVRRAWEWDDLREFERLLKALGVRKTTVFPMQELFDIWKDSLPVRWAEWGRIENGLKRLIASVQAAASLAVSSAKSDDSPFVPTPLQRAILNALEHRALTLKGLAKEVSGGDQRRLNKPNGLQELKRAGLVAHKPGLGFYRPDAPPRENCSSRPES